MKHREMILVLMMLFGSFFLLVSAKSGYDTSEELFSEEEYPDDLDTLEEFIQSYYLLLDSDSYLKSYSFIDPTSNSLENDQQVMGPFYQKLLELRNGLREQVIIFQIGDSHVQSGYMSGTARSALQKYFGNAGRGLIFPYRLARTNQPDDYQINSSKAFTRIDKPRSMSGYTLANNSENELRIKTNSFFKIDCTFDQALIYADSNANLEPDRQTGVKHMKRVEQHGYSIHHLNYEEASNSASITLNSSLRELYGISLERHDPGLLYHSMGVNGAGFYNLAESHELFTQISLLKPDLLIISLGTNDAQGKFRPDVFTRNLDNYMTLLKAQFPDTPLLFTLPPDSRKAGKTNKDIAASISLINDYALSHKHAVWNLYAVMGGSGSISKWREQGMAAKDYLHFTPKGYMLQGHLLYQAIIKGYKAYSEQRED